MPEQHLAKQLALLATETDSLEKSLALAEAERATEAKRRERADIQVAKLRDELRHARERAKAAERDLGRLSSDADAELHAAQAVERELRVQLDHAQARNEVLRHEVERLERERRALQRNQRELLGNLRHAAEEARLSHGPIGADDVTLVPTSPTDVGW
jgi:chromosome segregation ATPase